MTHPRARLSGFRSDGVARRALVPVLLTSALAFPAATSAASSAADFELGQIAPGVYVHVGHQELASAANGGDIANLSFVIGKNCVAVVDTGNSLAIGRKLDTALRGVTSLPVCYVINTHMHPDHVLGNPSFLSETKQFVGHYHLPRALATHGASYLRAAAAELGTDVEADTIVAPTLLVHDDLKLELGERTLELRAWPTAHTDSDITVYDGQTGTLWTGDLVFAGHVPALDGNLSGWIAATTALRGMQPRHFVLGHGPLTSVWETVLERQANYLNSLNSNVRAALRSGKTLQQTVDALAEVGRDDWLLFDEFNRRNVTAAYAELEWAAGS